jgi:hypothetical protein
VQGGYGGVYVAALTDSWILPVTSELDQKAGMYGGVLKTLSSKPNAHVTIGKPFKLEAIENIDQFLELLERRNSTEDPLQGEERATLFAIIRALKERSSVVMHVLNGQLNSKGDSE